VALRVGVAFYLGNIAAAPPLLVDQVSYHVLATRLLAGHGFSFSEAWYPFTSPNVPTAHWSFLQSLYLAGVYALFGPQPLAARLVTAVLGGILLPGMVYLLARRVFWGEHINNSQLTIDNCQLPIENEWAPVLAALIAAVYPYFVLYGATLMTETLFIVALLWALERTVALAGRLRFAAAGRGRFWGAAVTLGLALGVATLFRQSILPWVPVAGLWVLWVGWRCGRLRRALGGLALAVGILALCILPFTARNYRVYGEFLLLNSNTGYGMYSAQHPMHGTEFREFDAAPLPEDLLPLGLNEAQWDRELMRRGIGFVLAEPGRYLLLSLSRIKDYFEFWPTPDTSLLHNVGRSLSFGLLLPFAAYGVYRALRARGNPVFYPAEGWTTSAVALLLLFVVFYSVLHILTWAFPRYRLPVDAVLVVFAGLGVGDLGGRVGKRPAQREKTDAKAQRRRERPG
jgi:hypothetical protein